MRTERERESEEGRKPLDHEYYTNDLVGFLRWWVEVVHGPRLTNEQIDKLRF